MMTWLNPVIYGKYYTYVSTKTRYDLYDAEGSLLFNDTNDIRSIGCEMFECSSENGIVIVNGLRMEKVLYFQRTNPLLQTILMAMQ